MSVKACKFTTCVHAWGVYRPEKNELDRISPTSKGCRPDLSRTVIFNCRTAKCKLRRPIWFVWSGSHSQVNMVVADDLALISICRQGICNNHDDMGPFGCMSGMSQGNESVWLLVYHRNMPATISITHVCMTSVWSTCLSIENMGCAVMVFSNVYIILQCSITWPCGREASCSLSIQIYIVDYGICCSVVANGLAPAHASAAVMVTIIDWHRVGRW